MAPGTRVATEAPRMRAALRGLRLQPDGADRRPVPGMRERLPPTRRDDDRDTASAARAHSRRFALVALAGVLLLAINSVDLYRFLPTSILLVEVQSANP